MQNSSDNEEIRRLRLVLNSFRAIENDLPVSYATVFLYVAQHELNHGEPPSVSDISNNTGMFSPTISRITQALGGRRLGGRRVGQPRTENSRKSLGLLERRDDPVDLRITRWALSVKGRGLLARVCEHVRRD